MKHILNNLSEQEKNSIREQHTGGMKVMIENFSKLTNSKLGDSKPLVTESDLDEDLSGGGISKTHPINNPFYKQMISDIEGDGVETVKFVPNKMLVIDAFGHKYTITKS